MFMTSDSSVANGVNRSVQSSFYPTQYQSLSRAHSDLNTLRAIQAYVLYNDGTLHNTANNNTNACCWTASNTAVSVIQGLHFKSKVRLYYSAL